MLNIHALNNIKNAKLEVMRIEIFGMQYQVLIILMILETVAMIL